VAECNVGQVTGPTECLDSEGRLKPVFRTEVRSDEDFRVSRYATREIFRPPLLLASNMTLSATTSLGICLGTAFAIGKTAIPLSDVGNRWACTRESLIHLLGASQFSRTIGAGTGSRSDPRYWVALHNCFVTNMACLIEPALAGFRSTCDELQ
jgi:hypothetical protein